MKKLLTKFCTFLLLIALGVTTVNGMFSNLSSGFVLVEEEVHGSKSSKDSHEVKEKSLLSSMELSNLENKKVDFLPLELVHKTASHALLPEIPPDLA